MKGQLISADQARPATRQHRKPCRDCPWQRTALNGWLGGLTADDWLQAAHGEARIDCHTRTGAQCAGAAIYRANMAKRPRDLDTLQLPADRGRVFSHPEQFRQHHAKLPGRER